MKCTALVIGLLLVATIAVLCAVTVRKTSSKSCNNIDRVHLNVFKKLESDVKKLGSDFKKLGRDVTKPFRPSTAEERRQDRCDEIKKRENELMESDREVNEKYNCETECCIKVRNGAYGKKRVEIATQGRACNNIDTVANKVTVYGGDTYKKCVNVTPVWGGFESVDESSACLLPDDPSFDCGTYNRVRRNFPYEMQSVTLSCEEASPKICRA